LKRQPEMSQVLELLCSETVDQTSCPVRVF
jgi:hypothetical protein